jgi:tetratricopeptide (TPR) repeat protein
VFAAQGQTDKAIQALEQAISLKPDDADAHYNLGVAYGQKIQRLLDQKIAAYQRAIQIRPGQAEAHYQLAIALLQKAYMSGPEEKRELLQRALAQFRLFQEYAPTDPKASSALQNIRTLEPLVTPAPAAR